MFAGKQPTLHVIAGPNGAGKSTLYATRIAPRFPDAEFVNADLLARKKFGHNAVTEPESRYGQEAAEHRRLALLAARRDFVTESTFSHPSKLELIRQAKAAGYRVIVYHVNVRDPELSVQRVEARVAKGGHPVPADRIRERYVRNQQLILAAARLADKALVFDNSDYARPPQLVLSLGQGRAATVGSRMPAWAAELYQAELEACGS